MTNLEFTKLVQKAYLEKPDIVGLNWFHPIRIKIYIIDGILNIIPQGSKTFQDWIGDFNIFLHEDKEPVGHPSLGLMHVDFLHSSLSVIEQIAELVKNQKFNIGGHSRGGSQSVALVGLLANRGLFANNVYLIEPARVFPLKIPDIFNKLNVWGCWNGNDPVPFAPLAWQQFILEQIGKPLWPDAGLCHHIDNVVAALVEKEMLAVAGATH